MSFKQCALSLALAASMSAPAWAVVVDGNTTSYATTNTSSAPFAGFANVGTVNGSTGVYLGNGYVLTAAHVGTGSFTLTGVAGSPTYSPVSGSTVQLTNSDGSNADMVIFKLSTTPSTSLVSNLTIGSTAPSVGSGVYMAGNGYSRLDIPNDASDKVYYDSSWNQLSNSTGASYSGYQLDTSAAQAVRFGQAVVTTTPVMDSDGVLSQIMYRTTFYDFSGSAQAVSHDSGGGVFDGSNVLRGLIVGMGSLVGQPSSTAIFGDQTAIVDLSAYRNQIYSITLIPEPAALGSLAATGLLLRRKRR